MNSEFRNNRLLSAGARIDQETLRSINKQELLKSLGEKFYHRSMKNLDTDWGEGWTVNICKGDKLHKRNKPVNGIEQQMGTSKQNCISNLD